MDNLTTGKRIAHCRKKLGLSQEGLGEKMGVSRQAIYKWEADAAMPDVDKLIALSKLFSVSVGWLLGVEEQPEVQPEAPQISEELLHKIEAVVQQYQPQKRRLSASKKVLIAMVAVLLLWCGIQLGEEWNSLRSQVSHLSSQINKNSNSAILSQLNALENRIDSINDTIEQGAAVLAEYEFQIDADPGEETAFVHMNAIPKTWNESWTATLSVRHEGSQTMSQTCAWDGSALVSGVKLNLLDGYEFWLVIGYPDGSQEQVRLQDPTVEMLKHATSITCDIMPGHWTYSSGWNLFSLHEYSLYLAQPTAMEESRWIRADFILYHIRDGQRTVADTHPLMDENLEMSMEFWTDSDLDMEISGIEPNDRLELWFEAELENGLSCCVKVDSWAYQQGQFVWELK